MLFDLVPHHDWLKYVNGKPYFPNPYDFFSGQSYLSSQKIHNVAQDENYNECGDEGGEEDEDKDEDEDEDDEGNKGDGLDDDSNSDWE